MFGFHPRVGPLQKTEVTHPTLHETKRTVKWPVCIFNKAALLWTFCVDPTSKQMEKDPATLLPRVSFNVEPQKPSSATVFLISDNDGGFQRAFFGTRGNQTSVCESIMAAATATMFPNQDTGIVTNARALRGSKPTKWYAVAVDCSRPQIACPNISQADITLYHPNTESEPDTDRKSVV